MSHIRDLLKEKAMFSFLEEKELVTESKNIMLGKKYIRLGDNSSDPENFDFGRQKDYWVMLQKVAKDLHIDDMQIFTTDSYTETTYGSGRTEYMTTTYKVPASFNVVFYKNSKPMFVWSKQNWAGGSENVLKNTVSPPLKVTDALANPKKAHDYCAASFD